MKKFVFALISILLSCSMSGQSQTLSSNKEEVTLTPTVSGNYNAIKVSGEFKVIYCDPSEPLKITANNTVIKSIECVVENNTLFVRYIKGKGVNAILGGKAPVVRIPAKEDITSISLNGTSYLECATALVQDDLDLELNGTSRISGEVRTSNLSIHCAGTVNAVLTGSSDDVKIQIDGASRINLCDDFECDTANVIINGAGVVRINCIEKISGKIAGASVVRYRGNPEIAIVTNGVASIAEIEK